MPVYQRGMFDSTRASHLPAWKSALGEVFGLGSVGNILEQDILEDERTREKLAALGEPTQVKEDATKLGVFLRPSWCVRDEAFKLPFGAIKLDALRHQSQQPIDRGIALKDRQTHNILSEWLEQAGYVILTL